MQRIVPLQRNFLPASSSLVKKALTDGAKAPGSWKSWASSSSVVDVLFLDQFALRSSFFLFQQLELITPFQLYFNPELIFKHFQVSRASQPQLTFQCFKLAFCAFK